MRTASSGSLVPAMGLADGEGAGDAAVTEGNEWPGSGDAAVVVTGVLEAWGEVAAEDATMAGTKGDPKRGKSMCYQRDNNTQILCCVTSKTFTAIIYASLQVMTFKVLPIDHF